MATKSSLVLILTAVLLIPYQTVRSQSAEDINNWLNESDNPANWPQSMTPSQPTVLPPSPVTPQLPGGFSNQSNLLQKIFGGQPMQAETSAAPPQNPFNLSRRDILRILFGGSPGGSSGNPNAVYGARENLQVARDQASQAEDACSRASYGSDQGARQSAASEAHDHANAARAAADRATSSAEGGSLEANDAAAQARNEADRAQAAADRASANANGGGW